MQVLGLFVGIILSSSALSATIYNGEYGETLDLSGRFETGGFFNREFTDAGDEWEDGEGFVDDTFMSFAIKGRTGHVYTTLEFDVERQTWTPENRFQYVIDKAYGGWDFGNGHRIEFGRTDTAYDRYDAYGDFSVYGAEGAADVSEAGDQDGTLKYEGEMSNFRFGVSYSKKGSDGGETDSREGQVFNGYVGFFSDQFTVLFGAEEADDRGNIYSAHGTVRLGDLEIGSIISYSDRRERPAFNTLDSEMQVLSAQYHLRENLKVAMSYSNVDVDFETIETTEAGYRVWVDDQWGSISAEYSYRPNAIFKVQVVGDGEDGTFGYGKLVYYF